MALLDPITNAPKNQKIALGVTACVIVAALGYFLLLSPKQIERDALRGQGEQVRAERPPAAPRSISACCLVGSWPFSC